MPKWELYLEHEAGGLTTREVKSSDMYLISEGVVFKDSEGYTTLFIPMQRVIELRLLEK